MNSSIPPAILRQLTELLNSIQNRCREYVTQDDHTRKMTFAGIRTSAETVGALAEDEMNRDEALLVRHQVHAITQQLDELLNRSGSDEPGRCRACGHPVTTVELGASDRMSYCTHCPAPMLEAVREISDLTGAEIL